MRTGWFYILGVTLLFWVTQPALAERHAIVVGVNQGPSPLVPLRYAHDDARKIEEILRELGGVPKSNMRLLLEPDLEELQSMLWTTTSAAKPGDELFFYYSGHADDQGLLLHNERFPQAELRALLDDNRFQVRVAVIDACKSGSFTREKGGSFGPPIDFDWALDSETKGAVLITSSSAEEASVERDDLGGSLFTHFWASALRGAADHNNDAQVTLSEAFAFAYEKTLVRSADSRSGIQHPNYDYEIKGRDELTLTNLAGGAKLIFPESTLGTYLVFHRARGSLVAELEKVLYEEKQLHLPPGDYVIKKRIKNASLLLTASIGSSDSYVVEDSVMKTLPLTDDLSKGYETPIFEPTWKHGAPFDKVHRPHLARRRVGRGTSVGSVWDQRRCHSVHASAGRLIGLPLFGVELNAFEVRNGSGALSFQRFNRYPRVPARVDGTKHASIRRSPINQYRTSS